MDTEVPVQEQLPQIRRISGLEDVRRVIPLKSTLPPGEKARPPERSKFSLRFFIIGLLFFGILGFELAVIHRYDRLNKRLYQISTSLKDKIAILQNKLQYANGIRDKLVTSRRGLVRNYLGLTSQYKILQFKIDDYRDISLAKSSRISMLEGDLRVAYANVEAVKVQNELLAKELMKRDEYIRELTSRLINSIGEQELLVDENLQLKKEIETLKRQVEVADVNK